MKTSIKKNTEKSLWEKGEVVRAQVEVYSRLAKGYMVLFFQEGMEGTDSFRIEMATDAMELTYFHKYSEEIRKNVEEEARGRQVHCFNL